MMEKRGGCFPRQIIFVLFFSPILPMQSPPSQIEVSFDLTTLQHYSGMSPATIGSDSKPQIKTSYSFIANQITTETQQGRISVLASQAYFWHSLQVPQNRFTTHSFQSEIAHIMNKFNKPL